MLIKNNLQWLLRLIITIVITTTASQAFCPDFLASEKACTCFAYLDGAVIKCQGPSATSVIEKLKEVQTEIRELSIEDASIIEVSGFFCIKSSLIFSSFE